MKNSLVWFAVIGVIALAMACNSKKNDENNNKGNALADPIKVPSFSQDSAYEYVKKQVEFGPRVPNSSAHKVCGDFLTNRLKSLNATVSEQQFEAKAFNGKLLKLRNIIASFKPENPKRIILAAHWDTRPFAEKDSLNQNTPIPGANDGGSGVGVLLEIARILSSNPEYKTGIDIILFDGEDYGDTSAHSTNTWCLGSQYWSNNKHKADYAAYYGILLDMVGAKNALFSKEEYSVKYARQIVTQVWEAGSTLGYGKYFLESENGAITDDHKFVNEIAKIPMIDIIELHPLEGFGNYHHTHNDNMDIIDKETLKAVGQTILYVIYHEEGQEAI